MRTLRRVFFSLLILSVVTEMPIPVGSHHEILGASPAAVGASSE
jgi:hypothetical protein